MKNTLIITMLLVGLSGCGQLQRVRGAPDVAAGAQDNASNAAGQVHPRSRPNGLASVPDQARTVEDFDTTTAAQRADAGESAGTGRALGKTVASLGDPTQPGFWLKTPLVKTAAKGRIRLAETGKSVQVDLLPIEGAETAGSRISLAALRLLGVPLTALPTIDVFTE